MPLAIRMAGSASSVSSTPGATDNVIGEHMLKSVELKDGAPKKRGVVYEVANGVRMPNLGERTFAGMTDGGSVRIYTVQVCEVNKALLSVSKIVAAGNKVVFGGPENSYIEDNATGERIWLEEIQGMYAVNVWVKLDGSAAHLQNMKAGDF